MRILLSLILLVFGIPAFAQQGFHRITVPSTEGDELFDAAAETSIVLDVSDGKNAFTGRFAVQAYASAGTTTCTYNVKGSLKPASFNPSGTDFVDLPSPVALSCLTSNDERLHFYQSRFIRSIQITLASLAGGSGVTFDIMGQR